MASFEANLEFIMSEESPKYENGQERIDEILCGGKEKKYSDKGYVHPDPEDVKRLKNACGWSNQYMCDIAGIKFTAEQGSSVLRKWMAPSYKRYSVKIPYAVWRLFVLEALGDKT